VPINGKVLAEMRWLAGMDQVDLANASCVENPRCKMIEGTISAYEREAKRPTSANLTAMLKALRKQLAKRGLELTAAHVRALIRTPTLDAASSNGSLRQEGHADRRHAGKTIVLGGFAAALAPRSALERITSHGDRRVDAKLITDHEDIADAFAAVHRTGDPVVLGEVVAAHADMLSELLDRAVSEANRRRLEVIAVSSHAQAGMLAFILADHPTARRYFALARNIAEDSGDAALLAQSYCVSSLMHSSIRRGRRGGGRGRALTLLSQAADYARSSDTPTRYTVQRWLAEELAVAHNEYGFRQALAVAEDVVGKTGHHDGRQFFARRSPVTPEGWV
jgi:hypothetical protein